MLLGSVSAPPLPLPLLLSSYIILLLSSLLCVPVCAVSTSKGLYSRKNTGANSLDEAAGKSGR